MSLASRPSLSSSSSSLVHKLNRWSGASRPVSAVQTHSTRLNDGLRYMVHFHFFFFFSPPTHLHLLQRAAALSAPLHFSPLHTTIIWPVSHVTPMWRPDMCLYKWVAVVSAIKDLFLHGLHHRDSRALTVDAHSTHHRPKPELRHLYRLIFEFTCKIRLDKSLPADTEKPCVRIFYGCPDKKWFDCRTRATSEGNEHRRKADN